ncbi:MFS transporter [Zymobacter sp. IVIA_5232.4 C2]|uniref:MFS transporter n=1 Tax=Zymobacter sp. IVIA_5232.4 C2 TaxID=3394855 RepID=UPI0039C1B088
MTTATTIEAEAKTPDETRRLSAEDAKILGLSALGGALEFYDFVIYVFFASAVQTLFFPANMPGWLSMLQTFGIFAMGYLARPLGGIVMAHFGDMIGRKKMFMFSILLMALPTLLIGLLPTYATIGYAAPVLLLIFRVCQGAAIGGEAPGAWVFVAEHAPKRHVALACGALSCGLVFGILMGSIVVVICDAIYSHADQITLGIWRYPFLLGGVLGLVTLWLRRYLQETPVFARIQARKGADKRLPLKEVLAKHGKAVGLSMLVTWMLTGVVVVILLMLPNMLPRLTHTLSDGTMHLANMVAIIMTCIGCLMSGFMADRVGEGRALATFSVGVAVTFTAFYATAMSGYSDTLLFVTYALTGFFVGIIGVIPALIVRIFPAEIRFSGVSFSYNVAYAVFGGATPILLTMVITKMTWAPVVYICALSLMGIVIGAVLTRQGVRRYI